VNLATVGSGDVLSIDSADDITATAATIIVASGAFGATSTAAGEAIETNVSSLSVSTSGASGNQFIREADGLAELNLNALTGGIDLLLVAPGDLLSDDNGVDVTGGTVAITVTSGAVGDTDTAIGNALQTSVTDLTITTSDGNGHQFVRESNGLTRFALNAGTGTVLLLGESGGLFDDDTSVDVTALAFAVTTLAGAVGQSTSLIDTDVVDFEASATGGGVFSSDASAMTLGGVLSGMTGVSATGSIDIRSFGTLSVNENVMAGGAATLQVRETGATATGDILAIASGVSITATGGSVTLNAGDAVTAGAASTITASTTIVVNIDNGAGQIGVDDDTMEGGIVDFDTPTSDPVFVAPGGMTVTGGANDDRFDLKPQAGATISLNGAAPSYPTVPGDTLNFDLSEVANGNAILTLGDAPGAGFYRFLSPETEQIVSYRSIETVNTPVADFKYHLVLDMQYSQFQNDSDDSIVAQRTATDLRLDINEAFFYSGNHNSILSFTIIGSSDDDYLEIRETAYGLPKFSAATPAIDNSAIGGGVSAGSQLLAPSITLLELGGLTSDSGLGWSDQDVTIHFDGGNYALDNDEIEVTLEEAHLVFATGTATLGNLVVRTYDLITSDTPPTSADGLVSFANLGTQRTLRWNGGNGAIFVEAFSNPGTTILDFKDVGTATDGYNRVEGDGGFLNQEFGGFELAYVLGGSGAEKITLESADSSDGDGTDGPGAALIWITLDADDLPSVGQALFVSPQPDGTIGNDVSNDILAVESLPAEITVNMLGGAGNDEFRIYDDNNTISSSDDTTSLILGQVLVSPQGLDELVDGSDEPGGQDRLVIRDFGDSSADTVSLLTRIATATRVVNGEIVEVDATVTDIDGLFDAGAGVDISFSQIEILTLDLGTAGDTIDVSFDGLSDELDSVTISGNAGADVFNVLTSTAATKPTTTVLLGGAGDDQFVFSDAAVFRGASSVINGNAGNDTLDFTAYQSSRNIYLTAVGPTDGYQGYESDWTTGASFQNVDVLMGSGQAADFLYGADRNTTWALTGSDAGKVTDGVSVLADPICICGDSLPPGVTPVYDLDFSAVENIRGGSAQDWFDVAMTFSLTGSLGGGTHVSVPDTLDYRDWTTAVSVDLTAGTATAITGGVAASIVVGDLGSSIENLLGGSGDDFLVGDAAPNSINGFAGADTLNGKAGVDTIDGGANGDMIQVAGTEAQSDTMVGGIGATLDATDYDVMVNVGSEIVTLNGFNLSSTDFSNSIDEYDGGGFGLAGADTNTPFHLGFTLVRNTPTVAAAGGSDAVTVSFDNEGTPVAYSGGAGTADSVLITMGAEILGVLDNATLASIQSYLSNPTNPLAVTSATQFGNFTAEGFESARIAVYDDGEIIDITSLFLSLKTIDQIVVGTTGDDSFTGTDAADLIFGMDGNDVVTGLQGSDYLFGGTGNDILYGGDLTDTLVGGSGNDRLYGEAAADWLLGGVGDDTLEGGHGADLMEGGVGNDQLLGGDDSDRMLGGEGNDRLSGVAGNDELLGGAGIDSLLGGDGDDVLNGGTDGGMAGLADYLDGEVGNDEIKTQAKESEFDVIQGGLGLDRLTSIDLDGTPSDLVLNGFDGKTNGIEYVFGNGARVTGNNSANTLDFRRNTLANSFVAINGVPQIDGCAGDDFIYGTDAADTIVGNSGSDVIFSYKGNDVVYGNAGNDVINGGEDGDTMYGGDGGDTLVGLAGNDSLFGQGGADRIEAGDGDDTLDGGADDTTGALPIGDTILGGAGNDVYRTRNRDSEFDSIQAGVGQDRLINVKDDPSDLNLYFNNFLGMDNGLEEIDAGKVWVRGNSGPNRIDFRYGTKAKPFLTTFGVLGIETFGDNDVVYGANLIDTILGGDGADELYGAGLADSIDGGAGNDLIYGGADADTLVGGDGDDRIYGETGNDLVFGNSGLDLLDGGDGDDILNGGIGVDDLRGGAGNDIFRVQGTEGATDSWNGGAGSDRIVNVGTGDLTLSVFRGLTSSIESLAGGKRKIVGTTGADELDFRLVASAASFVTLTEVTAIEVGAGNDKVYGTGNADTILGGDGDDSIFGYGGNDLLRGEVGVDAIDGGLGNDTLEGGDGNDTLLGAAGNDMLVGAVGADRLEGGDGDDVLDGGADVDTMIGGGGNDNFRIRGAEALNDSISGGAGADRITNYVDNLSTPYADLQFERFVATESLIEAIYGGGAWIRGTANNNLLDFRLAQTEAPSTTVTLFNVLGIDGGDGNDIIRGTRGNDSIYGGNGDDSLFGYGGNDFLSGGEGADVILGHDGNDTIVGGNGADTLTGGVGADIFRFEQSTADLAQLDLVQDYFDDTLVFAGYSPAAYATWTWPVGGDILTVQPSGKRVRLVAVKVKPAANRVIIQG
jgi:Ca2+-binding RTX toxin-like protein